MMRLRFGTGSRNLGYSQNDRKVSPQVSTVTSNLIKNHNNEHKQLDIKLFSTF